MFYIGTMVKNKFGKIREKVKIYATMFIGPDLLLFYNSLAFTGTFGAYYRHSIERNTMKQSARNNEPSNQDKPELPPELAAIKNLKSKRIAYKRAKDAEHQRVSRRIELAKKVESFESVCEATGIVVTVNIPRIPGYAMVWTSPLSELSNCRGLASKGKEYLSCLDTQILAGILITLADDYSLFRYAPAYSGAQKNAIIRSAGKEAIISAALLIENWIHSGNVFYLPKLSLLLTNDTTQGEVEANMIQWMKEVAERIAKASYRDEKDSNPEDRFYSEAPKKTISVPTIARKASKANKNNSLKRKMRFLEQKAFKTDVKNAKALLKTLLSEETISPKLATMLKSVFTEDTLLTMDTTMRLLLATKMEAFSTSSASSLIAILKKPYAILRASSLDLGSLDDDDSTDSLDSIEENDSIGEATATPLPCSPTSNPTIIAPAPTIIMALDFTDSPVKAAPIPEKVKMSLIDRIRRTKLALSKQ